MMSIKAIAKSLIKLSRSFSFSVRKLLFKFRGNKFGNGTYVASHVALRESQIGAYTYIGPFSSLNRTIIGNYCSVSACVSIGGEEHAYFDYSTSDLLTEQNDSETQTVIGNDVWIGAQCYIRMGVKIGDGAVIGANSFVNKNVPPYAIVAGSPARIIRFRFDDATIVRIQHSEYWKYSPKVAKNIINTLSNS